MLKQVVGHLGRVMVSLHHPALAPVPNRDTPTRRHVIFGASGYSRSASHPAILNPGWGSAASLAVSASRAPDDPAQFRVRAARTTREVDDSIRAAWTALCGAFLHAMDRSIGPVRALSELLATTDAQLGTSGNYLFYFAVGPSFFSPLVKNLAASGLIREADRRWRRIVIEKPFGHDLATAIELNRCLREEVGEQQIFRIDHPGKETVPERHGVPLRHGCSSDWNSPHRPFRSPWPRSWSWAFLRLLDTAGAMRA